MSVPDRLVRRAVSVTRSEVEAVRTITLLDKLARSRTFVQFSSMSFSTIFILIFVAVGLGIAAFGARGVIQARASSAWPQVSGEITHSEITDSDSSYSPLVRYEYSVSDRAFAGERICFGLDRMFAGYKFAQRYTQRYPVGSPVAVYYDPDQPSQSVLEPGITKRAFIPMAFGLGFAIFGGWFALTSWLFR